MLSAEGGRPASVLVVGSERPIKALIFTSSGLRLPNHLTLALESYVYTCTIMYFLLSAADYLPGIGQRRKASLRRARYPLHAGALGLFQSTHACRSRVSRWWSVGAFDQGVVGWADCVLAACRTFLKHGATPKDGGVASGVSSDRHLEHVGSFGSALMPLSVVPGAGAGLRPFQPN